MADQNAQQEPSMEEILASIRKIISEDDEAEKSEASGAAAEQSGRPAPREDDDVLELTEVIETEAGPPPFTLPDEPPTAGPKTENPRETVATTGSSESATSRETPASVKPEDPEKSARQAAGESGPIKPEPIKPEPVESAPAGIRGSEESKAAGGKGAEPGGGPARAQGTGPAQSANPQPFAIKPDPAPGSTSARATDSKPDPKADPRPARDGTDDREIITDRAASAAFRSLSELTGALGESRPRPDLGAALPLGGSGRTVEDLVREMLRPMLREWLDANLPDLVQRLVQKEIKEMVRRAEDR